MTPTPDRPDPADTTPAWIRWATDYAAEALPGPREIPAGHLDDTPAYPTAADLSVPVYPRVVPCTACGEECDTICLVCGHGIHGGPCLDRHPDGCENDPPPEWLQMGGGGCWDL
jgi:hypothetical protein